MAITFKEYPGSYAKGRRANAEEWNGISRTLEGTDPLGFGVPAAQGSLARGCVPVTEAGQSILGITETNYVLPHPGDEYQEFDTVAICESGVIGVQISEPVAQGAEANFDTASGKWTDAAASATVMSIPGATFDTAGAAADDIVLVRYRRANPSVTAGV